MHCGFMGYPCLSDQCMFWNTGDHECMVSQYLKMSLSKTQVKRSPKVFIKPTETECMNHFSEKYGDYSEGRRFWNYYEANGWMVGRNKMKDWQAAARNWMSRKNKGGIDYGDYATLV